MVDTQMDDIVPCVVRPIIQDWPQSGKDYERKLLEYISRTQEFPKQIPIRRVQQMGWSYKYLGMVCGREVSLKRRYHVMKMD